MPDRALEGVTVIEYNRTGAAAYASKLMADLGADVIKIEPPSGDPDRALGPFPGGKPHPEKSGTFLYLNCNKQSVTLDITTDSGRQVLDKPPQRRRRVHPRRSARRGRVTRPL